MTFKKYIALILTIALLLLSLVGCRKVNNDMSSGSTSDLSSTVYGVVDVVNSENTDSSEIESSDDTTSNVPLDNTSTSDNSSDVTSENIFGENVVNVGDSNNEVDPDAPLTFIDSESENSGDAEKGYDKITCTTSPNSKTGDIVTVLIASNGSVNYQIRGVSNKILTINDADAYVVYNNVKYEAKNGVVTFVVESKELASTLIPFEIGNKSATPKSFTVNFSSPKGSRDNPEDINSIDKAFTINLERGNQQGYTYKYNATKNGKIRFYILSDAKIGQLSVDKIIDPKLQVIQQRNTTETNEEYVKSDTIGTYIEFDVKNGDRFNITASPNSETGDYPAVTIEWKIVYC